MAWFVLKAASTYRSRKELGQSFSSFERKRRVRRATSTSRALSSELDDVMPACAFGGENRLSQRTIAAVADAVVVIVGLVHRESGRVS
jgi:hypothetical protein